MKLSILILFICSLVASKVGGQTAKMLRDYRLKPKTDTAYVYIEARFKKRVKDSIEIWHQDLQTGDRWRTHCPKNGYIPKTGEVVRMLRSQMIFIEPKK